jgi:hypothetical protein
MIQPSLSSSMQRILRAVTLLVFHFLNEFLSDSMETGFLIAFNPQWRKH